MAATNKGKSAKSSVKNGTYETVSVKKPYIQVNHEYARDIIIGKISVFGEPMYEKCPKKDENGKQVYKNGNPIYSYYVKGLWSLKNEVFHNIMISQSTMAFYDENTRNIYSLKINFEDKTEIDIRGLLDSKEIFDTTLKYSEKYDINESSIVHRSVSFNVKLNDLFNQTSKIVEAINKLLSGKVTIKNLLVPVKELTNLNKKNFPNLVANTPAPAPDSEEIKLTKLTKLHDDQFTYLPVEIEKLTKMTKLNDDQFIHLPDPVLAPTPAPASAQVLNETIDLCEVLKKIEHNRAKMTYILAEENNLKFKISNSDEELKHFEFEMKNRLEEGIKKINKDKEENIARLEVIKNEKILSSNNNDTLSKLLIEEISKPILERPLFTPITTNYRSWADSD